MNKKIIPGILSIWVFIWSGLGAERIQRDILNKAPRVPQAIQAQTPPPFGGVDNPGAEGLVSWWSLDEDFGIRADSFGTNNLNDNRLVLSAAGKKSDSAFFSSVNTQFLSVEDNPTLDSGDNNFTTCGWMNLKYKNPYRQVIISKWEGATNNKEYYLGYALEADRFIFSVSGNGSTSVGSVISSEPLTVTTNTWYFVCGWHNAEADTINIQVNNGAVNSSPWSLGVFNSGAPLNIGRVGGLTQFYNDGMIDETFLYNRLLTSDQRGWLYNNGNGRSFEDVVLVNNEVPAPCSDGTGFPYHPMCPNRLYPIIWHSSITGLWNDSESTFSNVQIFSSPLEANQQYITRICPEFFGNQILHGLYSKNNVGLLSMGGVYDTNNGPQWWLSERWNPDNINTKGEPIVPFNPIPGTVINQAGQWIYSFSPKSGAVDCSNNTVIGATNWTTRTKVVSVQPYYSFNGITYSNVAVITLKEMSVEAGYGGPDFVFLYVYKKYYGNVVTCYGKLTGANIQGSCWQSSE